MFITVAEISLCMDFGNDFIHTSVFKQTLKGQLAGDGEMKYVLGFLFAAIVEWEIVVS